MSQEQPERPQTDPIKYGDVFPVSGEVADQPIAPRDAAMMQATENLVLGQTQKGGPAAVIQSAATRNELAGLVSLTDITDIAAHQGVTVTETDLPGRRVITESVAGQVVSEYVKATPVATTSPASALDKSAITMGEALEAVSITAGDKPVDQSDALAIQAAEVRATGSSVMTPGGVAAEAQSAASMNARALQDEDKTRLGDILKDATAKLPADKAVTQQDAEGVVGAELRNNPNLTTHPGGVSESPVAAARINQSSLDKAIPPDGTAEVAVSSTRIDQNK